MKSKIEWIEKISEKDKGLAYSLFDWENKDKWNLGGIYPSGNRNLYFRLSEPINSHGTNFRFLKIKGHHYMKNNKMHPPEAKAYTGKEGNPANIKILRKNPSVPKGKIEHRINYGDYTLYLMKTYERPNGCMFLEEVLNEVKIQYHLLENDCHCPLPIGIVEYNERFNDKKLGAHIMAMPYEDVRTSHLMEGFLHKQISNDYKLKLLNCAVEIHFKGLRKLHKNNVIHLFAHFANSAIVPKKMQPFYCDFENSVLLDGKNKEYNNLYKAVDLTEALCRIYYLKKELEKKKKIFGDSFDSAFKGYGFSKNERGELSYIYEDKCFGSFIKFCDFNFDMALAFKDKV
jgi:serine/threonine protein kinase